MINVLERFQFSRRYVEEGAGLPFGLATIFGADSDLAKEVLPDAKSRALDRIRVESNLIRARVELFDAFFRRYGFKCPLPHQFATLLQKGFPTISPHVDALLIAELTHGVLMGIQDPDPLVDDLSYDLASKGEQFPGMRGNVICRDDEMVLRDGRGIVASYFQGPDKRTSVGARSSNLIFYAFAAPGIDSSILTESLMTACGLFDGICESAAQRVFTPSAPWTKNPE